MRQLKGKIWVFGDDIDTDAIIPARHLNTSVPRELALHCMEDADPTFAEKVGEGDIIVAGGNFGCGSSREHAPIAIKVLKWRVLSQNPLPGFSIAIPSISVFLSWSVRKPSGKLKKAMRWLWIWPGVGQ